MNTQKTVVILVSLGLAALGGLFYLATEGNTLAAAVLFSLWTIVCVVIGWGLSIVQQRAAAAREQQAFMANAKENLALMGAIQSVQNRQNAGLIQQLNQAARLPRQGPGPGLDSLLIEDAVFSELEQ